VTSDEKDDLPKRGYCIVKTDSAGVVITGSVRFQTEKTPLNEGEQLVKYFSRTSWSVNIGAERRDKLRSLNRQNMAG
jgi:hypothetical protein